MKPARGIRAVAVLEAAKGALVLVAGFTLAASVHAGAQGIVDEIVGHLHLNPANAHPHIFVRLAGNFLDRRLWLLATLAGAYAAMRFIEAYGLWRNRRWAEWFAAASGGVYVPFEIYELSRHPSWIAAAALLVNVAVVAFMLNVLRGGGGRGA